MSDFFNRISNYKYPYIIAEIGANHNGDMDIAKKLIKAAKDAGADCVKFQSWTKNSVFSQQKYDDNIFLSDDYRDRQDFNLIDIVDKFSISEKQLFDMMKYCLDIGIEFSSTPFSFREVDYLVNELNVNFLKIASMDINNYPFLEYVGNTKKPIVISTGLSDLFEIDKAIRTIESTGNDQIIILHCIAKYPPEDHEVNLNKIDTLKINYPNYCIGFSDHSIGTCIPTASVIKGVKLIEKHFTLDKSMFGWDHKVSANPEELKSICEDSKRIVDALGSSRVISIESDEVKSEFRRSIVSARELNKGEIIKYEDLDFKRPATGLAPEDIDFVIGRKIKRKVLKDYPIKKENLE